ncbi:MAG TPA: diacylglycerol kinase [Gemmataceae bacterium]|jgi:diacylglycerol kinase|nr:diacylglycerol kinase [Gemmataceae bacterium]
MPAAPRNEWPDLVSRPEPPWPTAARSRRPWRDQGRAGLRGIKLGVRGHSRFFVHIFFAALALAAAVVLRCGPAQWCLLLGCVGLVFTAELFHSAVEALHAGLDAEARGRAGPCLDIAAGALLLAALTAGVVGGLVLAWQLAVLLGIP